MTGALPDSAYRVEALAKGLRVLASFSDRRPALRLKELAELTGLPLPTAFRIVATLVDEGYLERLPDGVLRPGIAVLTLGFAALHGLDLVATSTLVLRKLATETGHTVNLGILMGDRVLYVVRLHGNVMLGANVTVGSTLPAVLTSMGKLLLALRSDEEVERTLDATSFAGAWGPNAVRSLAELRAQFARIRADDYAIQDQELSHGLRSIAGPIRRPGGEVVAAVNVAVPASECTARQLASRIRAPLVAACQEISLRLGAGPTA